MVYAANLGYPRIGAKRQLKTALEGFWNGKITEEELSGVGKELRNGAWKLQEQSGIDFIPSNDFSYYDHVLDTCAMVGAVPERFQWKGKLVDLQTYFLMARGLLKTTGNNGKKTQTQPMEITKWFNTNYHFIVPELSDNQRFNLASTKYLDEFLEAKVLGILTRPVILGPVSFLNLAKGFSKEKQPLLLDRLVEVYCEVLSKLKNAGCEWVQLDEPILATDLEPDSSEDFRAAYKKLATSNLSIMLTSYFSEMAENLTLAMQLPVNGIHLDLVNGSSDLATAVTELPKHMLLSTGVIDGHNIWRSDLSRLITMLEDIGEKIGPERLIVAPSCSLLHVPIDVTLESSMNETVKSWLAFANQKIGEISIITDALCLGLNEVQTLLEENRRLIASQQESIIRNDEAVEKRLKSVSPDMFQRASVYSNRYKLQQQKIALPQLPTTTIGSFPQTKEIREARKNFKANKLSKAEYEAAMQQEIESNIAIQEKIGLDVFVHGEPERTDMVEYFADLLNGIASSQHGWVQSYGSRYVKPPIIYGAVSRPAPMTVEWAKYAQSLTKKPVKGMLTGPVTILQWSFVRDDQTREKTCTELALVIRDEVKDLESAGINVVQIDEPAIREGLPLRNKDCNDYLKWAVNCFKLATSNVSDETQIHTHMCYSEFGDMVDSIARMDADVISIEAARSQMDLLDSLKECGYPNSIGPGVYDIHSPRVPSDEEIDDMLKRALDVIPPERLWVNPDCGLKTRNWEEVIPALNALVQSAIRIRKIATRATIR